MDLHPIQGIQRNAKGYKFKPNGRCKDSITRKSLKAKDHGCPPNGVSRGCITLRLKGMHRLIDIYQKGDAKRLHYALK